MTEAWAWGREEDELVDRRESPWDDPSRRPSHADKRRAWRRELLAEEIRAVLRPGVTGEEFRPSPSGCLPWRHESELNRGKYSLDGRLNKPVQQRLCFVGSTGLRLHYGHPTLRSM